VLCTKADFLSFVNYKVIKTDFVRMEDYYEKTETQAETVQTLPFPISVL